MPFMKSTYRYTKYRKDLGRQPLFQDVPAQMLDSIAPYIDDQKQYTLRNPVDRHIQATLPQSSHETNTKLLVTLEQGVDHKEGGWPRDVRLFNEEHLARYRRRVTHDENYIHTVLNLAPVMEHYIHQNNAIDMYQAYFDEMNAQEPVEKLSVRIANVFRDELQRPVSCVKWTNDKNPKLVAAYSHKTYILSNTENVINDCYLWDVNIQTTPVNTISPKFSCWQLACSPTDPEIIIGGLVNGTVNVFDIRVGANCVLSSSVYTSHQGPITSLLFSHSRTNTEIFSGSTDGQCIWWDCRNLSKPLDMLMMSIRKPPEEQPSFINSEGVSSLEFDSGLPTKFLCGTESGLIINVNKMERVHSEKLVSYWNAHTGPVRCVQRSPCTLRMFLSCGDSTIRVWSEEVRTGPIITTKPFHNEVMDAVWAPRRYSSFMSICAGGLFYYWDLLRKYDEPLVTLQVSKDALTRMNPLPNGRSVAMGDCKGSLHLIQLSDIMAEPSTRNKALMSQLYERQRKREHILDNRVKEIRLKIKSEEEATATNAISHEKEEFINEDCDLQKAEEEYFKVVNEQISYIDHLTPSNISLL